jgi:hypothetical protein
MAYTTGRGVSGRLYGGNPVRNTIIGAAVLLVLLVGAGVAYTYYFGPENNSVPPVDKTTPAKSAFVKPTKPSPNSAASASVTTIMSPEKPGENAALVIKTNAGSDCKIVVMYGTMPAKDSGLADKKADEFGVVQWTWTVPASAPPGTWPVSVTCFFYGKSAVVRSNLVVPAPGAKPQ